jgi:uncharacterized damage-inducible protein DinB
MRFQTRPSHKNQLARPFFSEARRTFDRYLPRIIKCLAQLSDDEIWWRPNPASNSVGNIVLHLSGNIRQWIIAGVGGVPDVRERDKEFSERGPIPRAQLKTRLTDTVREACLVLDRLPLEALTTKFWIQGYHATGLQAISTVYEHFSHHAGQIIYITKLKRGSDLHFTHLPPIKKRKRPSTRRNRD